MKYQTLAALLISLSMAYSQANAQESMPFSLVPSLSSSSARPENKARVVEKEKALEHLLNEKTLSSYFSQLQKGWYSLPYEITMYDGGIVKFIANSHILGPSTFLYQHEQIPTFSLSLAGKTITIKQYPTRIAETIFDEQREYKREKQGITYLDSLIIGQDPLTIIHELLTTPGHPDTVHAIFYGKTKIIPLTWSYEGPFTVVAADLQSLITNKKSVYFTQANVYGIEQEHYFLPLVFEIEGENLKIPFYTIKKFSALGILQLPKKSEE